VSPPPVRSKLSHPQPGQDVVKRQPVKGRIDEPAITAAIVSRHDVARQAATRWRYGLEYPTHAAIIPLPALVDNEKCPKPPY